MKKLFSLSLLALLVYGLVSFCGVSYAFFTPHPVKIFDQGLKYLDSYRGDEQSLNSARENFLHLISKFPESPLGYLGMSRVTRYDALLYQKHYNMRLVRDQSLPFALKALELGPSLRASHENYASIEQIFKDYQKNEALVKEYINLFPDSSQTYFALANLLQDQEEYDQAQKYYHQALEMNPSDALRYKILKRMGMICLQQYGQPDEAIRYFEQALGIKNDCPFIHEFIGLARMQNKEYDPAIQEFSKAVSLLPSKDVQFYLSLCQGYLAEEKGDFYQAISFFEKALLLRDQDSILHYTLGNLYFKVEQFDNAYGHFRKVIALNPQNTSAYYLAGRSAYHLGFKESAMDYYQKFLQMDADSQEADWIRENIPDLSHK